MTNQPGSVGSNFRSWHILRGVLTVSMIVVLGLASASCEGMGSGGQSALQELAAGQKQIMERLDKLEKSQQEILTASKKGKRKRRQVDYNKVHDIALGSSPFRGAKEATVTLVEFSDFQCPYSKRVQPLIQTLLEAYPEDLQHVYKNYPLRFHKRAEPAARACIAAGLQGKYWEMHAKVYENTKKLEDSDLKEYAKQIGLDESRFDKDYQSDTVKKLVTEDMSTASKAQVTGTPTLFLNGKRVRDRSPEAMKKEIESLRDAKKKG